MSRRLKKFIEVSKNEVSLTKEQKEELQKIADEIMDEAKNVVEDYKNNPSEVSGSEVHIHENSPFLDADDDGQPLFSGSRWTKVLKRNVN